MYIDLLSYPLKNTEILKNKRKLRKELINRKIEFIEKRILLLSGSTIGETKNILELFLLKHGIKPVFLEGNYARYFEDALYPSLEMKEFKPDIVYIHTTSKNIEVFPLMIDTEDIIEKTMSAITGRFQTVWNSIKEHFNCVIIQNNFEMIPYRPLGNAESYHPAGKINFINKLNSFCQSYAYENDGFYINDINYLSALYGLDEWFNYSQWYLYQYAFDLRATPILANSIASIIKSIYGKNKKAIIVDLDNTLWGGVIGDEGVENIKLGEESPQGRAFTNFQKYLKNVSDLGIMLNVCSKNEESIAIEGFGHKSSVLKKDDFIYFVANWTDKSTNVNEIVKALNICKDSVVFLDDNPVEREIVKKHHPDICVPDLSLPEDYIKLIDQEGFFELTTLSADDLKRTKQYKENVKRDNLATSFVDYSEFLKSLTMECTIIPFQEQFLPRITQLINKTNQFNLTTRRYSEDEIQQVSNSTNKIKFATRLYDKYGDNGIVTVLIASIENNVATIDLWVMSCRVFKRDLEFAVFDELIKRCKAYGCEKVLGMFFQTKKNKPCADIYKMLGFNLVKENDWNAIWELTIPDNYEQKNNLMEVTYYE